MSSLIYEKLAVTNLKNNRKTYVPYILTATLTVMLFYIIDALSKGDGVRFETLRLCLRLAAGVVAVFAVIFLFYTNSFLIKRRKKELGVYNILGMGKRHIARMMAVETVITAGISMIGGVILGIVFGKLMYLLLLKILKNRVDMQFAISRSAIGHALLLFGGIFILTYIYNLLQVQLVNPIELLHGGNQGEKEPKTRWILAIAGVAALGMGYWIAQTTEAPLAALMKFFVAVLCVIIGTYALFVEGSIVVLKLLRKNKSYYYNAKHFTSVSGMLYRMKQNSVGLANICILSTMVLVTVSATISLYAGMDNIMDTRFARDVSIHTPDDKKETADGINDLVEKECARMHVKITDRLQYSYRSDMGILEGNTLELKPVSADKDYYYVRLLTQKEYNQIEDRKVSLSGDEVLLYCTNREYKKKTIKLRGQTYKVRRELPEMKVEKKNPASAYGSLYLVFRDVDAIKGIGPSLYEDSFNLEGKEKDQKKALENIQSKFYAGDRHGTFESRMLSEDSFYELYGGIFFIGIYLGVMFLMATVLIIYYKQISEGYDDRERYQIMQKVGMSKKEVKRSIRSQVVTIFFLPLIAAVIHVVAAFKAMTKILAVLNLTNVPLFVWCTVVTIAVFAVFYIVVYSLTAREYYRIVN